jgi:hypothetical protein
MRFKTLAEKLAICQLDPQSPLPSWAAAGGLHSITVTPQEISIICAQSAVPEGVKAQRGFIAFEIEGPFDFNAIGVLESFLQPLAQTQIPIFAISTYNTDYILVNQQDEVRAREALRKAGHEPVA